MGRRESPEKQRTHWELSGKEQTRRESEILLPATRMPPHGESAQDTPQADHRTASSPPGPAPAQARNH